MVEKLITYTPLQVCASAIRTCWQSQDKSDSNDDTCGENDKALIDRIGNKFKHASTLEHLILNFIIDIRDDALIQFLENKYVIYTNPILTINMRTIIDMLNDKKYYLSRNVYLMRIINLLPEEYKYLISDHLLNFLGKRKDLDEIHYCYENGIIEKHSHRKDKDFTRIPYFKLPEVNDDGYLIITNVKLDDNIRSEFHHRIIGKLFIDNTDNKPFINNIDGDKKNNRISNLEWVTASENEIHSYEILGKQVWNKDKKLPSGKEYQGKIRTVLQLDLDGSLVKEWFNPTEAAIFGGFNIYRISDVCCGRSQTHKKFIWKYKEQL